MTRATRRFIFYIFIVVFLFVTPPTILYSVGYSFDWENYKITQTGGLYFKTTPPAKISIDGRNVGAAPRLISQLSPRGYLVEITRPGFMPWRKTLNIQPRLVTEARNIFLFPEKIQPSLLVPDATSTISRYIFNAEEKARDIKAGEIASTSAGWLRQNGDIFYISSQNYILYQTNIVDAPAFAPNTATGKPASQISKESLPKDTLYEIAVQGKQFAALAENGKLYLLSDESGIFQKIADDVKGIQISTDGKKLLYSSDHEIYIYFLEDILLQPYKKAGDRELITRHSQKITQAIFWPNNEYIAFVAANKLKAAELDARDIRNTYDIYSGNISEIYFSQKDKLLYVLAEKKLLSIDLAK